MVSPFYFQWHVPSFNDNGFMKRKAEPQLRDNINSKDSSLASCSQCDLFPLVGVDLAVLSSPSNSLRLALGVDYSRLKIANATSRWCWLPMGLLCEIKYLRELPP